MIPERIIFVSRGITVILLLLIVVVVVVVVVVFVFVVVVAVVVVTILVLIAFLMFGCKKVGISYATLRSEKPSRTSW